MFINEKCTTNSLTYKAVRIDGIAADRPVSDDLLAGFAMASIDENPSSLFGWSIHRSNDGRSAIVQLDTD